MTNYQLPIGTFYHVLLLGGKMNFYDSSDPNLTGFRKPVRFSRKEKQLMKRFFFIPLVMVFLVACSGGIESTPTATAPAGLDTPAPGLVPAATDEPAAATATPEGYPGVVIPEAQATSPYPADEEFWLVRAAGLQCEDPAYPDLESAVAALEDAGVNILESEATTMAVCEACGCPTPEHYRIRVLGSEVNKALPLGWAIEQ
jgi:hypothetical protein